MPLLPFSVAVCLSVPANAILNSRNRRDSKYDQSRRKGFRTVVHRRNSNTTTTITTSNPTPPAGTYQSLPPCMLHASRATGIIAFILCFSFSVLPSSYDQRAKRRLPGWDSHGERPPAPMGCLLYTSDAADEE